MLLKAIIGIMFIANSLVFAVEPKAKMFFQKPSEQDTEIYNFLKGDQDIQLAVDSLNDNLKLSSDLNIIFNSVTDKDTGPYYDSYTKEVIIPYHFWNYVKKVSALHFNNNEKLNEQKVFIKNVLLHTLYHEIAHYLIDTLKLPITGIEENVADEFAALSIIQNYQNSESLS